MIGMAVHDGAGALEHAAGWPSRRLVAWTALMLNCALWAALLSVGSRLAAAF